MPEMTRDGKVGDLGGEIESSTIFTIDNLFDGDSSEYISRIRAKLGGCMILEERITEEGKRKRYFAKVRSANGIPDFSQIDFDTKVFEIGAIPYFENIRFHSIRTNKDNGSERLTFLKWISGELKTSVQNCEFSFTEDTWWAVHRDFTEQERYIKQRQMRGMK